MSPLARAASPTPATRGSSSTSMATRYIISSSGITPTAAMRRGSTTFWPPAGWIASTNTSSSARGVPLGQQPRHKRDPTRRVDLTERFDDAGFAAYGFYRKGSVLATALWDAYLNLGGSSSSDHVRRGAPMPWCTPIWRCW